MIFLKLIRIRHWSKNLFLFLPVFFAGELANIQSYHKLFIGFITFSLVASTIYIFNDLLDLEEDRAHPINKNRPLASGKINKKTAIIVAVILLISSFIITNIFFQNKGLFILLIYFGMNILYSVKLKTIPILDVFILATGFILRITYGGVLTDTLISKWLVLMVFLLSLFMGFAKRRSDLVISQKNTKKRKSLNGYNVMFLDSVILINVGISIVCHIMYTVSDDVTRQMESDNKIYLSSIFVFYGTIKYLQNVYVFNNGLSPVDILWKDRQIQMSILGWLMVYAYYIYII